MATIYLTTSIRAPINACFDAARSVDAHLSSAIGTNEKVIAGRMTGLFEAGDIVTWEARHLGIRQRLTVEISRMIEPTFFEDKMLKGAFKSMRHEHHFAEENGLTIMTDLFQYETPFGILGALFDKLYLESYMRKFLQKRNLHLKQVLEGA
ncbi:SRPBCC family protein [Dyadobacter sp. SG02]|uniref:SRPBCC family protein n=1 Tax=Dyadobacter sp. SG02 TaxID=1855291 RepID=UPI000B83747C|nr:SRPBCC family protein [Dyadobacter sp. SG02]